MKLRSGKTLLPPIISEKVKNNFMTEEIKNWLKMI